MSPFDLPGPEFLVFYLVCGAAVLFGLRLWRNAAESGEAIRANLSDPYSIAFLRGGRNEMLRVATVSLIDRKLLRISGTQVSAVTFDAPSGVRSPLERQILGFFSTPREAHAAFAGHAFDGIAAQYESSLAEIGALPDGSMKNARMIRLALALVILWTVAFVKIAVALTRGRSNIQILVVLALLFALAAYRISNPRITGKGQVLLRDLQTMFGSLQDRVSTLRPGSNPNELVLLGAVFGIAAIPIGMFPHAKTLYPRAVSSTGGSDGSSCGSCGSSCGSSCGGGGGGGCGGCGS
jgi:uncharacterized protein (TIGR04222 family)